jgi:hypothetical protein
MNIKKILMAAAAAAVLSISSVSTASAASWNDHGGYGATDTRDVNRDMRGTDNRDANTDWRFGNNDRFDNRGFGWDQHRFADRRMVYASLRFHHIRYFGEPFFVRGHYVVRTFDRFGRIAFVEINPYTGRLIGYVRL